MQFQQLIGQDALKLDFIKEIKSEKIAHAQLLQGPAGHGGLPMALAFAQYLFCKNPSESDSCGTCPSCLKVKELQHPDLHFVYPVVQAIAKTSDAFATDWRAQIQEDPYFDLFTWTQRIDNKERKPIIGTEESKDIIRKLSLKSFEGGYKIMIIWMPEEMNADCANKLLKILEEPPAYTLFLLVSESASKLLVTIQSRTQHIRVPKIESHALSAHLQKLHALSANQADSVAAFADGNYLQAQAYLEASEDQSTYRDQFIQLMRVCYKKEVISMMDWADDLASTGKERQKLFIQYSLHMLRQSLLTNYMGDLLTRVSKEEAAFLEKFAPYISGNNIREFIATFDAAYYHIDRNANARILFTQLCFQTMRYIHQA
ncbi:MAG: polymerase subunit delta [Bacteroidota bacterium]|jgi:DNA polymerase-3 subunit delta'